MEGEHPVVRGHRPSLCRLSRLPGRRRGTRPTNRTMQKIALITGITGQDGAYLAAPPEQPAFTRVRCVMLR